MNDGLAHEHPAPVNDAAFQRMREQGLDAALRDAGKMTIDSDKAHIRIAYE
jgi:hypothetical protein